jgi:hypothetical protein
MFRERQMVLPGYNNYVLSCLNPLEAYILTVSHPRLFSSAEKGNEGISDI